jgi:hypothetical protein
MADAIPWFNMRLKLLLAGCIAIGCMGLLLCWSAAVKQEIGFVAVSAVISFLSFAAAAVLAWIVLA